MQLVILGCFLKLNRIQSRFASFTYAPGRYNNDELEEVLTLHRRSSTSLPCIQGCTRTHRVSEHSGRRYVAVRYTIASQITPV